MRACLLWPNFHQVHCSAQSSFLLTTSGRVWAWGSGLFNVLGQNATQKQPKQDEAAGGGAGEGAAIPVVAAIRGGRRAGAAAGGGAGDGAGGEDGAPVKKNAAKIAIERAAMRARFPSSNVPLQVRGPVERQTVVELACGSWHVLALTLARKVGLVP